jgi:hypothetical protein
MSKAKKPDQRWKDILSGAVAGLAGALAVLSGAGVLDPALLEAICPPPVVEAAPETETEPEPAPEPE